MTTPRIALVGDRSPAVRAHARIPVLLEALAAREGLRLDAYWMPTDAVGDLSGFDGIWIVPGSPYRSEDGAVRAARTAREQEIPLLGTCAGFQHALLDFARNVCGLRVAHGENTQAGEAGSPANQTGEASPPGGTGREALLIQPLACSLVGHEAPVRPAAGSLLAQVMGAERTLERYHCAFGLNPEFLPVLAEHGLRFVGHDDDGQVRAAELPGHPFYLGTLFQPELAGDGDRVHPIVSAFAAAVHRRALLPA